MSRGGVNLGSGGGMEGGRAGGLGGMGCQHLGERVLEVEDGDSEELWEGLRGSAGVINDESGVRRWDRWDAPVSRPRPAHPPPPHPRQPPPPRQPSPLAAPPSRPFVTVFGGSRHTLC